MQTVENILNGLLSKTFLIEREVIYRDKKTKEDIKYMFRGTRTSYNNGRE